MYCATAQCGKTRNSLSFICTFRESDVFIKEVTRYLVDFTKKIVRENVSFSTMQCVRETVNYKEKR